MQNSITDNYTTTDNITSDKLTSSPTDNNSSIQNNGSKAINQPNENRSVTSEYETNITKLNYNSELKDLRLGQRTRAAIFIRKKIKDFSIDEELSNRDITVAIINQLVIVNVYLKEVNNDKTSKQIEFDLMLLNEINEKYNNKKMIIAGEAYFVGKSKARK